MSTAEDLAARALPWLEAWFTGAERHWQELPPGSDGAALGCWGTGWPGWGTQTSLAHASAAAVVSVHARDERVRDHARSRSLAALRSALRSHHAGPGPSTTSGERWGRTWISSLALERGAFAVELLRPHLSDQDVRLLTQVRCDEAQWLTWSYERNGYVGVHGGLWNGSGRNAPESNLWNGCALWRTADAVPDDPQAGQWRRRSVEFLLNGVSTPSDEDSSETVDGRVVSEVHRGANFFESLALDHHGYFNTGYATVCVSQAAYLHFDLAVTGSRTPESLHRHQRELWERLSLCITDGGRLVRPGGDHRVRYSYCQDYVVPALMYAADHLGDDSALRRLGGHLDLVERELDDGDRTSFFLPRLRELSQTHPSYLRRLEGDRVGTLAFLVAHAGSVRAPVGQAGPRRGTWSDPSYGVAVVRGERRTAHVSWRAHSGATAGCFPSSRDDIAEWETNLAPLLLFEGDGSEHHGSPSRSVTDHWTVGFPGGFAARGRVSEGAQLNVLEGFRATDAAVSDTLVVALPDDTTVIGLHRATTGSWRPSLVSAHGLNLVVPRDVHSGFRRRYEGSSGVLHLAGRPGGSSSTGDEVLELGETVVVDGVLRVTSLDAQPLELLPSGSSAGLLPSLQVDRLVLGRIQGPLTPCPGEVLVNVGWLISVGDGAGPVPSPTVEWVRRDREVTCLHVVQTGLRFAISVNWGPSDLDVNDGSPRSAVDLSTGAVSSSEVPAGTVRVVRW